ncbi:asparagine synthase (glutamine-hydrolyzing) [Gammaproteobacteria bacterium]|nr:asparagine synthase (glutamine-hydrolyzing) [Gammaproteobacteria bacterium]
MCGFVSIINLNGSSIDIKELQKTSDALSHRGPDGHGAYKFKNVGLAHRRLSILDLSDSGSQPMFSDCKRYVITYNGEIYNYKSLKKSLIRSGSKFHSNSDTEVLLESYIRWGHHCLSRLNGMFAFCIYDRKKQEMFIARDRYGIKPLYYSIQNNVLIFASEQKAIWAHSRTQKQVDKEAVFEYFTFQNILSDRTLDKNIRVFPQGSYSYFSTTNEIDKIKKEKRLPCIKKYWDFNFTSSQSMTATQAQSKLEILLEQAVKRNLTSDVEVASYLSGGMDSGTISAIASSLNNNLKTFTCGFDLSSVSSHEKNFDERAKAEIMSYEFNTEHYESVVKSSDMERVFDHLAWTIEEPRVGPSYPNYCVSNLASKFVKVVLSGTGGDEIFAGYPWRYYKAKPGETFSNFTQNYYQYWQRLVPEEMRKNFFKPISSTISNTDLKSIFLQNFNQEMQSDTPEDFINHCLYFESKTFLHGLLTIEDKISMSNGLETRVPLLDNSLVDFAMKCPLKYKLGNLSQSQQLSQSTKKRTADGKLILRKAMGKYIPKKITRLPKQGFSSPDASWFKNESYQYASDIINNKNALMYNFISYKESTNAFEDHATSKSNNRLMIWSLLNFEKYLKHFD